MVADVIFAVTVVAREVGFDNPLHLCFTRGWIVKLVKSSHKKTHPLVLDLNTNDCTLAYWKSKAEQKDQRISKP